MKYLVLLILSIFSLQRAEAQDNQPEPIPYVNTHFCIILSTKSYAAAKKVAEQAGKKYKIKIDYRDLLPNKKIGLTLSREDCEGQGWDYPAYYSRGRETEGEYLSIEYSNAFEGFTKGYYIVIVAHGDKADCNKTLLKVKPTYKTAYIKQTEVYVGCMH
jgi:hypothetical protein